MLRRLTQMTFRKKIFLNTTKKSTYLRTISSMKKLLNKKKHEKRLWSRLKSLWRKSSILFENYKNQNYQQSCMILDELQLRMTFKIQFYKKKELQAIELWKVIQKIHQKKKKMLLIDIQTIQSQVDFHNLKNMIEDKVQKEKCKKTEIRCDFLKDIEEILQHNQFKYKIMFCISLERKKIIHQRYITLNSKYIFSEFYIQARQL